MFGLKLLFFQTLGDELLELLEEFLTGDLPGVLLYLLGVTFIGVPLSDLHGELVKLLIDSVIELL